MNGPTGKDYLRGFDREAVAEMGRGEGLPVGKVAIRYPRIAVVGGRSRKVYHGQVSILGHRYILLGPGHGRFEYLDALALRVGQGEELVQAHDASRSLSG